VHGRTKRIDIKDHFIRDLIEAGRIELSYCATENMVADMFTKGASIKQFEKLRRLAGVAEFLLIEIETECWKLTISVART